MAELEKLQAATETGINIIRYGEKLADLQFAWNKFEESCKTSHGENTSYKKLKMAVLDYDMAKTSWELKNLIRDDRKRAAEEENSLHSHWRAAAEEILEAKKLLVSDGPGFGCKSAMALVLRLGGLRDSDLRGFSRT